MPILPSFNVARNREGESFFSKISPVDAGDVTGRLEDAMDAEVEGGDTNGHECRAGTQGGLTFKELGEATEH